MDYSQSFDWSALVEMWGMRCYHAYMKRLPLMVIFFGALHIVILVLLFNTDLYGERLYSGTGLYFEYASRIFQGGVPYKDFLVEYPPLSILVFILPRLVADEAAGYAVAFSGVIVLLDLVALALGITLARRVGYSALTGFIAYTFVLLITGPLLIEHYDLFPAVLTLFALYAFARGWHRASWSVLALGMTAKLYPVIIAPLFAVSYIYNRDYRHLRSGMVTFAVTGAVVVLPWLLIDAAGFRESLMYQMERGIQIESTYASFLLIADNLGLTTVAREMSHGSWNVVSPVTGVLKNISSVLMLVSVAAICWSYSRALRRSVHPSPVFDVQLVSHAVAMILVLLLTSKIFSPQYLSWLYPLVPLVLRKRAMAVGVLFAAIGALTHYVWPGHYTDLWHGYTGGVVALFARNILVFVMACIVLKLSRTRSPRTANCSA